MGPYELNAAFAKVLGLPNNCKKAVLTLEAGKLPIVEVTCYAWPDTTQEGRYAVTGMRPEKLSEIQFIVRVGPSQL